MSGNYVQRGMPAIFDKSLRAQAAVRCGADLVLELPITTGLSSAEGFASGGVDLLSRCCDTISFGTESLSRDEMLQTAQLLLSEAFPTLLREAMDTGISFPAARQKALQQLGSSILLSEPNDILGVEYCKAILAHQFSLDILPIPRPGSYHAQDLDPDAPSATAIRKGILENASWQEGIPDCARDVFENAPIHHIAYGERAILARLRTMTDSSFESLPYGSEGLWRKLMHASRQCADLDSTIQAVKSKRYTRTRIDRMILCALLGISQEMLEAAPPYVRALAFNERGRGILQQQKHSGYFINAGQKTEDPYWAFEQQCGALYGIFAKDNPEAPDLEKKRRVFFLPSGSGGCP